MAGSKFKKLKKALSPPSSPANVVEQKEAVQDDQLLDDLYSQLDSPDQSVKAEAATVIRDVRNKQVDEDRKKKGSKDRFKAREAKKASALAQKFSPSDEAAEARLEAEAKKEEEDIKRVCKELNVQMHEITPDGHCLFSAVADQLYIFGAIDKASAKYQTTRDSAASYMLSHSDDFIPFLPSIDGEDGKGASDTGMMGPQEFQRYCENIRSTSSWGGEPEITALCRAYKLPIHVVQSGSPPVVIHSPDPNKPSTNRTGRAVRISYHRRMYGLGEHYNSLRPKTSHDASTLSFLH